MAFLNPLALAGFALMIPVILLYMLRLRRREVVVSSTFLWQQVVRDREANTPWQRLRRNLLLFLQLIIIALLVLALARPYITVPSVSAGRVALLLDASASMNAQDGGPGTRFEAAVRAARDLIAEAAPSAEFAVIQVGSTADMLTPFTTDRQALSAALDDATAGDGDADWETAFTLAAAGAQGAESLSTILFTDGGGALQETAGPPLPELPGTVQVNLVGASADNLAITALATRALAGGSPQLYVEATNYGSSAAEVILSVRADGSLIKADPLTIPARASTYAVLEGLPDDYSGLRAGLTAPAGTEYWPNQLALDDAGYAVAEAGQSRRVFLVSTEGNIFLEQALRSVPGVQVVRANPEAGISTRGFDLIVLDGWLPETLPNADLLIVNPPESRPEFTAGGTLEAGGASDPTANIRTVSDDPLLRFVDLSGISLARFRDVSAEWAEPLVVADGGPLLLAGENGGRQIAILPFKMRDSNLPLDIAFPILMASLTSWFSPQELVANPSGYAVGDTVPIRPEPGADAIRVTPPDGEAMVLPLQSSGDAAFTATNAPGLYTVEALAGEDVAQRAVFAVNQFDPAEGAIGPQTVESVGGQPVLSGQEAATGQRELWPYFALAALLVLLLEWWIYFRRQRTPSRFRPVSTRGLSA